MDATLRRYPMNDIVPVDRPLYQAALAYAWAMQPRRARMLIAEWEAARPGPLVRADRIRKQDLIGFVALAEQRPKDAIAAFRQAEFEDNCEVCRLHLIAQAY